MFGASFSSGSFPDPALIELSALFMMVGATSSSALQTPTSIPEGALDELETPEDLMRRYVAGDVAAFEKLYRELSPKLFGYLLRLTRQPDRAEDLVQITFSKVHRARHSYMLGAPILPWILAIARRSFYDERRRAKVRPEDLSFDGSLPEPHSDARGVDNDMAEAVERAMAKLPESYAEAIVLTKMTGLSVAEASEVLGASKTAVKLRVHRGYNLLRQELESYGRQDATESVE